MPANEAVQQERKAHHDEKPTDPDGASGRVARKTDQNHQAEPDADHRDPAGSISVRGAAIVPPAFVPEPVGHPHGSIETLRVLFRWGHETPLDHRDPLANLELTNAAVSNGAHHRENEDADDRNNRNKEGAEGG